MNKLDLFDLSDDPIREVLARLPTHDLFRRVPLVCKRFLSLTRPLALPRIKLDRRFPRFQLIRTYEKDSVDEAERPVTDLVRRSMATAIDKVFTPSTFQLAAVEDLHVSKFPAPFVILLLEKFPNLKRAKLNYCAVNNELFERLKQLESIELVGLPSKKFMREHTLLNLTSLSISDADIADAGLESNKALPKLLARFAPNVMRLELKGCLADVKLFSSLTSLTISYRYHDLALLARQMGIQFPLDGSKLTEFDYSNTGFELELMDLDSLSNVHRLSLKTPTGLKVLDASVFDHKYISMALSANNWKVFDAVSTPNLSSLRRLVVTEFEEISIGTSLYSLFPSMPNLSTLEIRGLALRRQETNLALVTIPSLRALQRLSLSILSYGVEGQPNGVPLALDSFIRGLSQLKQLRKLEIGISQGVVSPSFAAELRGLRSLETLKLTASEHGLFEDFSMAHLSSMPRLRTFYHFKTITTLFTELSNSYTFDFPQFSSSNAAFDAFVAEANEAKGLRKLFIPGPMMNYGQTAMNAEWVIGLLRSKLVHLDVCEMSWI